MALDVSHKEAPMPLSKQNVFIRDESANVSSSLNHMRTQVNSLNDPPLLFGLRDLTNQVGIMEHLVGKVVADF